MSLRICPNPTFTTRVLIDVPSDDGYEKQDLTARFRFFDDKEIPQITGAKVGLDFLRKVIVELTDLVDEDGKAVTWSEEVREALLRLPYVRNGLIKAYFAAVNGAATGN